MATSMSIEKRKKMMLMTGLFMLFAIILLPMTGYIESGFANAESAAVESNPRSDYWRDVRDNNEGYSAVKGQETNELIQSSGQNWRQLRNGPIATYGGWLLGFTLAAITVFYLVRGRVELNHPRTGETIVRWTLTERTLHWITAGVFIVLAITGLSLLYGRLVLIPLFGLEGFSIYANIAKWVHNVIGPVFMLTLFSLLIKWFKLNFFTKTDMKWFAEFGGMIGNKHPSAGKLNGGEKVWFWALATIGVAMCITGLILDFPNFGQERELIQVSHLIHLVSALVLMAFSIGHIYIGTAGTEGALEGMTTGTVDKAWAKQHHDLWLEELEQAEKLKK
jgi:formate dehydrogenase subunit gamma